MIRIQGIAIVAARLQAAQRAARRPARFSHKGATAAYTSVPNGVQSDVGMDPRTIIQGIERHASLPQGTEDRFSGYAVIGLPFRSGHVLSLRRFPASPLGRDTSVRHRDPRDLPGLDRRLLRSCSIRGGAKKINYQKKISGPLSPEGAQAPAWPLAGQLPRFRITSPRGLPLSSYAFPGETLGSPYLR